MTLGWEVATDPAFATVVASGSAGTDPGRDHTMKVDVTGLAPAATYFYRFRLGTALSPTGITRTAPPTDATVSRLRFGVASCSHYQHGYFAAYRYLAERGDLDAVLHLGDYIYEYGPETSRVRQHMPPREIISLADYRIRHAQYKTDPHLRQLHATYPMIATWDDTRGVSTNNTLPPSASENRLAHGARS